MAENERKLWLSILAKSDAQQVKTLWSEFGAHPQVQTLRAPEIGSVMARARAGAVGAPFNLGEVSVTRASVQIDGGIAGHGYVQGRDKDHAQIAAVVDALMQTDQRPAVEAAMIAPLRAAAEVKAEARARKAAATKVDFFTMVRGED